MKIRFIIIFIIICFKIFPVEAVLIDFNNLSDTTVDFTPFTIGTGFPEQARSAMFVDLKMKNWFVRVNESSWSMESKKKTRLLPVTTSVAYPGKTLMGMRVYFPERYANSYAILKPPYTIPSFFESLKNPDGTGSMFINKGVVRNVGILRKVSVTFLGNNFRYGLSVRISNHKGEEKDIFIGYMNFVGWRTISWINPNLEVELKEKDLYKNARPYYPDEYPSIKFVAFIIQRSDPEATGNFVTMIKDVTIEYDEAFLEIGRSEPFQEAIFGIYNEELIERARAETARIHKKLYAEWEENQRMDKTEIIKKR